MKRLLFFLPLLSALLIFSSPTLDSTQMPPSRRPTPIVPPPTIVSMINLIATPEKFDGKMVSVVGFLAIETEDARLYLSEEDYRHYIAENGVFVDVNGEVTKNMEKADGHYVSLVGVFKLKGAGVSVGNGSQITDIRLCLPLHEFTEKRPRKLKEPPTENPH
jgi:uncharacterized Zn ribbon protein